MKCLENLMTSINAIRFIYDDENQKITLRVIDSENNSTSEIKCKLNNDIKIVINNKEYKTEICYSIDNNNRYWEKIFISDDENKLKILIFLQNPSNDKKIGTLKKLIKKFLEYENYKDNIYSITFINVYSKIDTKIKNWNDLYFNNTILTDFEKSNVDAIKILLLKENYDECYIGCGQHPCTLGKKGQQIKKYFLETYKKIVNMMLNKIISFKGFYDFTKYHVPDYPYSQKTKYNPIFRDIPIDLLLSKINQII
jgi:hypothetical protein